MWTFFVPTVPYRNENNKFPHQRPRISTPETKYFHASLETFRPCWAGPCVGRGVKTLCSRSEGCKSRRVCGSFLFLFLSYNRNKTFPHQRIKISTPEKRNNRSITFPYLFGFHCYIYLLVWKWFSTFGTVCIDSIKENNFLAKFYFGHDVTGHFCISFLKIFILSRCGCFVVLSTSTQ